MRSCSSNSVLSTTAALTVLAITCAPGLAADKASPDTGLSSASALSLSSVKNASFTCEGHDGVIKLKNGKAEGKFPGSSTFGWMCVVERIALGDLNGDGIGDAAAVIGYNGGGSGYFEYLVAIVNKNGKPVQASNYELGDRVVIKDLRFDKDKVSLVLMDHGPSDSLADTSIKKNLSFRFKRGHWKALK